MIRNIVTCICLPSVLASLGCASQGNRATVREVAIKEDLPRTSNDRIGVEVLTWHMRDNDLFDGTVSNMSEDALAEKSSSRLEESALSFKRIPESRLPALLEKLGSPNASMSTWCGQITSWRELRDVRVSRATIEIDNRPIGMTSGHLSLSVRAWVEPTVDSARLRVEFVPVFMSDQLQRASLTRSSGPRRHFFEDLATATDLPIDEVLLVTCTAPPSHEPPPTEQNEDPILAEDGSVMEEFDPEDDPTLDNPVPGNEGRGSRAINLGHALFSVPLSIPGQPPERVMIVIVPRTLPGLLPTPRPEGDADGMKTAEVTR